MFNKILVAIDTSSMSRWVFNFAVSIAKQFNAHLALLYVETLEHSDVLATLIPYTFEEYPHPLDNPLRCYVGHFDPERLDGIHNPELNLLRSYTHEAITHGVMAEFFQCLGDPGMNICDFAKLWQADLIIIGHRGRSGLAEAMLGSVSNYVAHHSPCSVHIVRPSLNTNSTEFKAIETVLH
ncbi:MAG TPA: universal stress protein [Leptolyngbyaceae cyanobacterium M33_DOE_097]|uniref:Universal stress protein n=1 Tax=Oscillatoriales cyanobacterium SpSt-418 TaxID=2282169 RepID=A0A7C3PDP3_9CYAN|nr:universal stress protein [Leptolyngbyaceae cyanobacterium M33_DOE_097]